MSVNDTHITTRRFEILRDLAVSGAAGSGLSKAVERALVDSTALLELVAGRIILWDKGNKPVLNVGHSATDRDLAILDELEANVFASLRSNRQLKSAFMVFGGENPLSAFTAPLYKGNQILGAALGVKQGESGLASESDFVGALAAAISLSVVAELGTELTSATADKDKIEAERLKVALELAVTVNHEINNPLTAALGNVQLILMQGDKLDPELKRKLEIVEKSALQIRDVTQKLLSLTEARSVTYAGDEKMIDLNAGSPKSTPPKDPKKPNQ